jgi:hypothetical protein
MKSEITWDNIREVSVSRERRPRLTSAAIRCKQNAGEFMADDLSDR